MALGPVMLDLEGPQLTAAERELLRHPNVGGVILFERNVEGPDQLAELVASIHALREPHLLVALDQEGGRVQRLREGFTRLPPMAVLGERFDEAPRWAIIEAEQVGWLLAAELLAVGIDVTFAPVLDLRRGISAVVGDRALHPDPEVVGRLGNALMRGMRRAGMAVVAKHFPGHGSVAADSREGLPCDPRHRVDIEHLDAIPFARLAHNGLPGIMPAHIVYPAVDGSPAGFSSVWLDGVLRHDIGFAGAVFSDDLSMGAVADGARAPERAERALAAGCDMVLFCHDQRGAAAAADGLSRVDRPVSQARLIRMHGHPAAGVDRRVTATSAWAEARAVVERVSYGPIPSERRSEAAV